MQNMTDTLLRLEEEIEKTKENFVVHQKHTKPWFDKNFVWNKEFSVGYLVLN